MDTSLHARSSPWLDVQWLSPGRAIAEVGAIMMVGGNIRGYTRTMTTAIALETSKGNLALALGLGLILISLATAVSAAAFLLDRRR